MNSNRIHPADSAKGIAILAIVVCHMFIPGWNRFIDLFALPLFLVLSGYFLSDRKSFGTFTASRAKRLLIPYALTCLLMVVLSIPKSLLEHTSVGEGTLKWLSASLYGAGKTLDVFGHHIQGIGAIWFLWALFWAGVLLRALIALGDDYKFLRLAVVLGCFILGVVSVNSVFLPLSIQPGLCALLWLYVGWLCRKGKTWLDEQSSGTLTQNLTPLERFLVQYRTQLFVIAAVLCATVWVLAALPDNHFYLYVCQFDGGLDAICASFAAAFTVYALVRGAYRFRNVSGLDPLFRFFEWTGENSLLILCIHILELNLLPWKAWAGALGLTGFWFYTAILVCKLVLILTLTYLLNKIPVIQKIFP